MKNRRAGMSAKKAKTGALWLAQATTVATTRAQFGYTQNPPRNPLLALWRGHVSRRGARLPLRFFALMLRYAQIML